jgi:hypothetical protein
MGAVNGPAIQREGVGCPRPDGADDKEEIADACLPLSSRLSSVSVIAPRHVKATPLKVGRKPNRGADRPRSLPEAE